MTSDGRRPSSSEELVRHANEVASGGVGMAPRTRRPSSREPTRTIERIREPCGRLLGGHRAFWGTPPQLLWDSDASVDTSLL